MGDGAEEEYYALKAKQDYGSHWYAQDKLREKIWESNYLERRVRDAGWLIQNIKHPEDVNTTSVESVLNQLKPPTAPVKERSKTSKLFSRIKGMFATTASNGTKKPRRRLLSREDIEEEELRAAAEKLREADRQKKLDRYLRKKVARIRILSRVVNWLSVNKQPAHHQVLRERQQEEIPLEVAEKNTRCYTLHPPERIVETLRTIDEVFKEDAELKKFRVPGHYHKYRGAEKIYPLHLYPSTVEALCPPGYNGPLPEDRLLPDAKAQQQAAEKARLLEEQQRRRVVRIKRAHLDMSRAQVKLDECATPPGPPRRVNKQFQWRARAVVDDNSVVHSPHRPVVFRSLSPSGALHPAAVSPGPESATSESLGEARSEPRSLAFHLLSLADGHTGSAVATRESLSVASYSQATLATGDGGGPAGQASLLQPPGEVPDNLSERAYRDNCLAENSTCSQGHVTVRLQRHRKVLRLDVHRLRKRPGLMSLRRKTKILNREQDT